MDFQNWQLIRKDALENPEKAQRTLANVGGNFKIPIFIQGAIHGNEYEGVDADMLLIERLATTPYGTDPEVDASSITSSCSSTSTRTPTAACSASARTGTTST